MSKLASVTSADGTRIGYDSVGDGPPVILVAGATQHRAVDQTTPELARLLADGGHRVINYDRRGRGESGDTLPTLPSASTRTSRRWSRRRAARRARSGCRRARFWRSRRPPGASRSANW